MYIWKIECIINWVSNRPGDEDWEDAEDYVLAAEDFTKAISKLDKLALAKSRTYKEVEDDGFKLVCKPVSIDITKIERGDWIDG